MLAAKQAQQNQEMPEWVDDLGDPLENIPGGTVDSFNEYEEVALEDGRILRRYATGSVRVENPTSGVIQDEKPDGSMVLSLPDGKVLFQEFRGEPLLLYDTEKGGAPGLARVSSAQLPGETQAKYVFHFQEGGWPTWSSSSRFATTGCAEPDQAFSLSEEKFASTP
jgi:hypothetical protein